MSSVQLFSSFLREILESLPPRPISQETFDTLVSAALTKSQEHSTPENRKSTWEFVLKDDIFTVAMKEGQALKDPHTTYYDDICNRLDIILSLTEHETCDPAFPFIVLYDLLETQTIHSCSHIFSWIEAHADRLTEGMIPQKGKALVLLRALNDLLRRLSKMGETTKFCGRILTFLSSVFALGERSGVNLRGEYGPPWDGPVLNKVEEDGKDGKDGKKDGAEKAEDSEDKMQVDEGGEPLKPNDSSQDFYHVFWSLQMPFSKPALFAKPHTLPQFKQAVERVLPVIKEATVRERALMGSKGTGSTASLKRKREPESVSEVGGREYFFAKYLTSPELLDLEIADTHFRRQFLFQLLVLLNHLLTFTKAAKAEWTTPRNRSLQMEFTLEPADVSWVTETITRANEELRQTSPNGRAFAETVNTILEREKNWVKWKNELCLPFDKEACFVEIPTGEVDEEGKPLMKGIGLEEFTRDARRKMGEEPPEWEHTLGSGPLTEIWEMGYRDLRDLERPFRPGDVKDFVKKVKQEDSRIEMRKKQLTRIAEQMAAQRARAAAAAAVASSQPTDAPLATKPAVAPPSSQEANVSTPPPSTSRAIPATPPLHHPLPAKPGTTPIKPAVQENTPSKPATPQPAPVPVPVTVAPAPVTPAPEPVPVVLPPDEQIIRAEESKQRWSWLALRTARDQHIQQFGKIGTGDIILLAQEIEKAKEAREAEEKAAAESAGSVVGQEGTTSSTPTEGASNGNGVGEVKVDEPAEDSVDGRDAEEARVDEKMET
ncbi:THO complex subunit 1 transcription elongation factor-domain-containing protein [Cristinia sonorae]|uniref:THO complex subunit 1 transcription elongation factor-domain-containing protein n=1 Tax=Cristinia sonorae TaxID=1940300 RepID=A0A8K0ULK2_9AGAR|nr:THO complex subunit 1 transcription elongation factor-domain-containing protein [Cristinia sonorae]